jgi:hypothetical protein
VLHVTIQVTTGPGGVKTLATLGIHNRGGTGGGTTYDWLLRYEETGQVVRGRIENFDRQLGWEELLRRVLGAKAGLDESDPGSGSSTP